LEIRINGRWCTLNSARYSDAWLEQLLYRYFIRQIAKVQGVSGKCHQGCQRLLDKLTLLVLSAEPDSVLNLMSTGYDQLMVLDG